MLVEPDRMPPPRPRTIAEAIAAVLDRAGPLPPRRLPLSDALGLILAEAIHADLDLPPFDKSLVDGYAIRASDLASGIDSWKIVGEIVAGQTFHQVVEPGQAVAIMTGAPLPEGVDSVIMVERCRVEGSRLSRIGPVAYGQNRLSQGTELRQGERIFSEGVELNAAKLGVLASLGVTQPFVHPQPRVSILPTGDELVPIDTRPGPGQIRESNASMLSGLIRRLGGMPVVQPVASDDSERLAKSLHLALFGTRNEPIAADILLVSGGVSAGNRDLVPSALQRLGAECVFHKVDVKPGKPLWFGVGPSLDKNPGALIFGLPGNPVSGLVSTLLFVGPALRVLSGRAATGQTLVNRRLAHDFEHKEDRPTYHPACLEVVDGVESVRLLPWAGSSDLKTVALADGFVALDPVVRILPKGSAVPFLPLP